MKQFVMVLLGLLVAASPMYAGESESVTLYYHRDTDVTAVEYCSAEGAQGVWSTNGKRIPGLITSVGSSTSWTSTDSDLNAFTDGTNGLLAAGDYVVARPPGGQSDTPIVAVVVTVADDTLTVGTAGNVSSGSGWTIEWFDVTCGTATTNGWYDVEGWDSVIFTYAVDQISVTGGIDLRPECRTSAKGQPRVVVTADGAEDSVTATGSGSYSIVLFESAFSECRFGAYIDSADDGSDTGADLEQVTLTISRGIQR